MELILLGSEYGGWVVPDIFNETSVCYFAGVGEDITFDVEFAKRYGCTVHLFDPTPRAMKHCDDVVLSAASTVFVSPSPISSKFPTYQITPQVAEKIKLHPIGLGKENSEVTFFPPADLDHVSHSIVNLQGTSGENGFTAKCNSISNIMQQLDHDKIDCLKLDIEGAELMIIEEILNKNIAVDVLCVEFDYVKKYQNPPLESVIGLLASNGYTLVSTVSNHTFIKANAFNPSHTSVGQSL